MQGDVTVELCKVVVELLVDDSADTVDDNVEDGVEVQHLQGDVTVELKVDVSVVVDVSNKIDLIQP